MTNKKLMLYISVAFLLNVTATTVAQAEAGPAGQELEGLSVEIRSAHPSYTLGEVVRLSIRVTNRSGQAISLPAAPSVANGLLRVLIAGGSEKYREYVGPGWSLQDVAGAVDFRLAPGKSLETAATLLYNFHPETAHLSGLYAQQINEAHVRSDYVFVQPGDYRIKAVLDLGDALGRIESQPVRIHVSQPQGSDLRVWTVLKGDAELGHLLQAGSPKGDPLSERSHALAAVLLSLASSYPESRQVGDIRASLGSYLATVEKLKGLKKE